MEDLNNSKHQHKLTLNNRKDCTINGVVDVLSFDVNEILLETEQGMLMIRGNALHVTRLTLEKGEIDMLNEELPPLKNFILPGGHPAGAAFHVARTVIRRAERNTVALGDEVNPLVLKYLNRLSDLLFMVARYINYKLGTLEPTLHNS